MSEPHNHEADCLSCDYAKPYYPDVGGFDIICMHEDNYYQKGCPLEDMM